MRAFVDNGASTTVAELAGAVGVSVLSKQRGASNEKAKRELGWRPRFASWRNGFAVEYG